MSHNFTITKILSIIYVVKLCGFKIICRFFNQRINLYIYHKSRASLLVFWKFLSKIKPAEVVGMYIVPLSNLPAIQGDSKVETPTQNGGIPFREVMQKAVQSLQESQQLAAQDAYELAAGQFGRSSHDHDSFCDGDSCCGSHSSAYLTGCKCLQGNYADADLIDQEYEIRIKLGLLDESG